MINVGKSIGRFLPASGRGVNKGRIAGGAEFIPATGSVFSRNTFQSPVHGNRPGGLIDKRQQVDPMSTVYGHPFDGGGYRSTVTQEKVQPLTGFQVTTLINPIRQQVPEIMPTQRSKFFREKITPSVKTVFGANRSGKPSDTPFHPQNKIVIPRSNMRSSVFSERVQNHARIPSFESTGNLWNQANHSFIEGRVNTVTGVVGAGRWHVVKRSVV